MSMQGNASSQEANYFHFDRQYWSGLDSLITDMLDKIEKFYL